VDIVSPPATECEQNRTFVLFCSHSTRLHNPLSTKIRELVGRSSGKPEGVIPQPLQDEV
jgi:hypothetical protein